MNLLKENQRIIVLTSSFVSLVFSISIFLLFFDERNYQTMTIISNILVIFSSISLLIPGLLGFLRFGKKEEIKNSLVSILYIIYFLLTIYISYKLFIEKHIIEGWIFLISINIPISIFITTILNLVDGDMENFEKFIFSLTINTIIFSGIGYAILGMFTEVNRNKVNRINYNYSCLDKSNITIMKYSDEKGIIYYVENNGYIILKDVTSQDRLYMNENTKYLKLNDKSIKITSDEIEKVCNLTSIQDGKGNYFDIENRQTVIVDDISNDQPFTDEQMRNNCANARGKRNNYNGICNF